jgi:hypothetical protein
MEVRKMCFGKPHPDYRAQIVADEAARNKKLLTGRVNVSWSWLNKLSFAGAHSGGNLRVRAFSIRLFSVRSKSYD